MKSPLLLTSALAALALAACGGEVAPAEVPATAWKLVETAEADSDPAKATAQTNALCDRHATIDLLFAHDDSVAVAAAAALQAKGRKQALVIGIGGTPQARASVRDGALAATMERATCVDTALDLCQLALHGVTLPPQAREFALGTRAITRDATGDYTATAAEFLLQVTRRQHPQALAADSAAPKQKIAVVLRGETNPFAQAVRADLTTAAASRPQIELAVRSANDQDAEQAKAVDELAAQGYRAIVVFGGSSSELATACKAAIAKGITVLALHSDLASDAYTYAVRTSDLELGKAAGRTARQLLPRGGTIVELTARSTARAAEQTHLGFLQGLGLAEAK